MKPKNLALLPVAALTLICAATAAMAQSYPTKSVKVIVPNTPGSGVDIVGRAVSQRLQEALGQPFVVENRPGAGTTTGIAAAAAIQCDQTAHVDVLRHAGTGHGSGVGRATTCARQEAQNSRAACTPATAASNEEGCEQGDE